MDDQIAKPLPQSMLPDPKNPRNCKECGLKWLGYKENDVFIGGEAWFHCCNCGFSKLYLEYSGSIGALMNNMRCAQRIKQELAKGCRVCKKCVQEIDPRLAYVPEKWTVIWKCDDERCGTDGHRTHQCRKFRVVQDPKRGKFEWMTDE